MDSFIKPLLIGLLSFLFVSNFLEADEKSESLPISPKEALERLMAGNQRYIQQKLQYCLNTESARAASLKKQRPFAAIVACSDSRVGPEIIFDQGIGSLFVVRVAGNLVDDFAIGSLEYAVKYLEVPLILVVGHTSCGVMEAFLKTIRTDSELPGHIEQLVLSVYPPFKNKRNASKYTSDELGMDNVQRVVRKLQRTPPILDRSFDQNSINIVGGFYDLETGKVTLFDTNLPPSEQEEKSSI